MRIISVHAPKAAAGAILLMAAACGPAGRSGGVKPAGETDLSCSALIYAAHELVTNKTVTDADGLINDKYFSTMNSYATAYAKEVGIKNGYEAFVKVKLEAFGLMGKIPSNSAKVPATEIVDRAKKCIAA